MGATDSAVATPGTSGKHHPATLGRRAAARALDVVLGTLLGVLVPYGVAAAVIGGAPTWLLFLTLGGPLVYAVAGGVTLVRSAATPGQALLGLYHVDAVTGRRAVGRAVLKLVLQTLTFGLWLVITPLTVGERNRSWFDRTAGVVVLDSHVPQERASSPTDRRVDAPPDGWHSDGHLTQPRPVDEEAASGRAPQHPSGRPAGSSSMIQAVPFDLGRRGDPSAQASGQQLQPPPATPTRQVRVRDARPAPVPR